MSFVAVVVASLVGLVLPFLPVTYAFFLSSPTVPRVQQQQEPRWKKKKNQHHNRHHHLQRNNQATATSNNKRLLSLFPDLEDANVMTMEKQGIEDGRILVSRDAVAAAAAAASTRREFIASGTAILATTAVAGTLVGGGNCAAAASASASTADKTAPDPSAVLPWEADPVNKRSGVTVFDAEKAGYSVPFVTYLSRFLLNFDSNCQTWWFSTRFPRSSKAEDIESIRIQQFAAFSASVELGLQNFTGADGPKTLLDDLLNRFGAVSSSSPQQQQQQPPSSDDDADQSSQIQKQRIARSARRHIALLFGLLEKTQPTKELTKLLASVDNGRITSVDLLRDETFSGFDRKSPPIIEFSSPMGEVESAQGRAVLKPTGRLLRLQVTEPGSGYQKAPAVTVSPPRNSDGVQAKARAKLASSGPNKGSIESVELTDAGSGYTDDEFVRIEVSSPEDTEEGKIPKLSAILDQAIDSIEITNQGSSYAVEKQATVVLVDGDNRKLIGYGNPTGEKGSFKAILRGGETEQTMKMEERVEEKYNLKSSVKGTLSGTDNDPPPLPFWTGKSLSSDLLRLLPGGVGLEFDNKLKRYVVTANTDFQTMYPSMFQKSSNRPIGLEFGPRGRAPIERNMQLDLSEIFRFGLSGAVCSGGVGLFLTPIELVKTKTQTNPQRYPGVLSSFQTIRNEEGASTFFTGWAPTLLGQFVSGGALYMLTEIIRRSLTDAAGADAVSLEVPIILAAAAISAAVAAVLICPFEAVRIRTVAQPNYAPNSAGVLTRMLDEEGIGSLINAIPIFVLKNIPYAMTKFTIFDISTEKLYEAFPAAQEDLKLSLFVSLIGGILGGSAAAVVSNPADAVISELKKSKSDISPLEAVKIMNERAGISTFFVGLPLRMLFYSLSASLVFVFYDSVRFALGIGSDDLKLYLDVLTGALSDTQNL